MCETKWPRLDIISTQHTATNTHTHAHTHTVYTVCTNTVAWTGMPYTLSVYSEKLLALVHICVVVRVIRVVVWVVSILCTLKEK